MSRQTVKATTIIGTPVENWEGQHLGVISEVMVNKMHGQVAYLVLSYPGEYGPEWLKKRFAVPFESIAMKPVGHEVEYILNTTEEFLRAAPGFDDDAWPDFADEKFHSVLKDYYKDISVDLRV